MTRGPSDLDTRLRRCAEALLEARSPEALAHALLAGALEAGCRWAWLWQGSGGEWQPVAASGQGLDQPAHDLVRAVLTDRLPASVLGGSRALVVAGSRALVVLPAPDALDPEALVDQLEGLLLVARATAGDVSLPPGPYPTGGR